MLQLTNEGGEESLSGPQTVTTCRPANDKERLTPTKEGAKSFLLSCHAIEMTNDAIADQ